MARLDWDRLRRTQPLDGADARVDPDGAVLWEREMGPARDAPSGTRAAFEPSSGLRWLRAGILVRRAREAREDAEAELAPHAPPPPPRAARAPSPFDASAWVECPRCRARVPRKKLLLHARASCTRRG